MNSKTRTYLVDTKNLLPSERARTEELLHTFCWAAPLLTKRPYTYMAHTECSADEFAAIPFPEGCTVTDVTDQDLMAYR